MTNTHGWESYVRRWANQRPPLRPHDTVVRAIEAAVEGHDGSVLLLGVTPELADIGTALIAVDWAESALAAIWPGDDHRRRALLGDWRQMPVADDGVTAIIGDGSLNTLDWPGDAVAVLAELDRVLAPRGIVALRFFAAPDARETPAAIAEAALAGAEPSFAALKWRLAMALTDVDGNVAVDAVFTAFEALFPDRAALAAATGWSAAIIAEIDAYRGSATRLAFPTRAQAQAQAGRRFAVRWIEAGDYPLAERCPVMVLER